MTRWLVEHGYLGGPIETITGATRIFEAEPSVPCTGEQVRLTVDRAVRP